MKTKTPSAPEPSIWTFRYRSPKKGVITGAVRATTLQMAIEVAKKWCEQTYADFLHEVAPFVLADEGILSGQSVLEEYSDEQIKAMGIGVLKPLVESGALQPRRVYELENQKPKAEQRQAVLLYCDSFINQPVG